jgi:hypothetical protein
MIGNQLGGEPPNKSNTCISKPHVRCQLIADCDLVLLDAIVLHPIF